MLLFLPLTFNPEQASNTTRTTLRKQICSSSASQKTIVSSAYNREELLFSAPFSSDGICHFLPSHTKSPLWLLTRLNLLIQKRRTVTSEHSIQYSVRCSRITMSSILDSIQLSIRNVHVLYRDMLTYSAVTVFGLKLSSLTITRQLVSGKLRDGSVNKLVEVKGLELYCNPFQSSHEVMRDDAVDSNSQGRELEANNDRCILVPLDVSLSLSVNRLGRLERDVPQYFISVESNNVVVSLDEIQIQQILSICDYFLTCQLREKYGRFRPWWSPLGKKIKGWQIAWWKYAQQSVLLDVQQRLRRTSWKYLGERLLWEQSKSYFKFENWWLNSEGFVDRVNNWSNDFASSGKPNYILAWKLKALKGKLKERRRRKFIFAYLGMTNEYHLLDDIDRPVEEAVLPLIGGLLIFCNRGATRLRTFKDYRDEMTAYGGMGIAKAYISWEEDGFGARNRDRWRISCLHLVDYTNRIYFRLGGKSYDITQRKTSSSTWFDWVESSKLHLRRMIHSRATLGCHNWSNGILKRCLVGCFPESDEMPTQNDVRRWAKQMWKGRLRQDTKRSKVASSFTEKKGTSWKEVDILAGSLKMKETKYETGKRRAGEYPLDIEEGQVEDKWGRAKSVACESGSVRVGSEVTPGTTGLKILLPKDLYKSMELDGQKIGPCFNPNFSQPTKIKTVEPFTEYIHSQQKNTVDNQDFLIFADELE
ncbi:putative geranylgeranyl transferase type-2 subunit beta [Capsicum annuum]|nr:putative geranylgeranyl transferase type-2 subunit beta [Capsicum annuum]